MKQIEIIVDGVKHIATKYLSCHECSLKDRCYANSVALCIPFEDEGEDIMYKKAK